jgi:enoyl-CoA hydratase/carnithine racemase
VLGPRAVHALLAAVRADKRATLVLRSGCPEDFCLGWDPATASTAAIPAPACPAGAAADAAVRGGKGLAADASGAVAGAEVAAFAADFGELTAALEAREAPTLCLVAGRAEGGGLLLPPLADVVFATAGARQAEPA